VINRILVAMDGSPFAEQTLPYAAALAHAFDAEIILLRVVDTNRRSDARSLDSFDWRLDRAEAFQYLTAIRDRLRAEGIPVDIDVTSGRAADEILEAVRARGVDLVVLGSHGTSGMSQCHMASTAHKVVFGCPTSVLVVPARETVDTVDTVDQGPAFTSVIVPVDGSPHSDWAISLAARVARSVGAELIMLHVVREPKLIHPQGTKRERELVEEFIALNRRAATRYLGSLKRRLETESMPVHARVEVADDVVTVLERHARAEERPFVVLCARGEARHEDVPYGSLVTVVLTNNEHPVLVLRGVERTDGPQPGWPKVAAAEPWARATTPH
jgi:nucleotide-binding universal stress UspA family protein